MRPGLGEERAIVVYESTPLTQVLEAAGLYGLGSFPRIFLFSLLPLFSVLRQWTCDGDEDDDDHHDDDDPDDDEETTKSGEGKRVQIQSP